MGPERWAGGIDTVGSTTLASVLSMTRYGGAIAACGLAGGMDLPTTVAPFILRGVSLIGIDSVMCPLERRREAWKRLASDIDAGKLAAMTSEIDLAGVMEAGRRIVEGGVRGRIVVKIGGAAGVNTGAVCADIASLIGPDQAVVLVHGTSAAADALAERTSRLARVILGKPEAALGRDTASSPTFTKTAALIGLIVVGLLVGWSHASAAYTSSWWSPWANGWNPQEAQPGLALVGGMALAIILGRAMTGPLFAQSAWNNVTFTAGEVENPGRNLPLALLIGCGVVVGLYLLANLAYVVTLPLAVLINQSTAGPAEVVASAILGNKRGEVVGTRSFGMGVVQKPIAVGDGSGLLLSVAKYYRFDGKTIIDNGIVPSVVQTASNDTGSLGDDSDSLEEPGNPGNKDDLQLKKALEVLKQGSAPVKTT